MATVTIEPMTTLPVPVDVNLSHTTLPASTTATCLAEKNLSSHSPRIELDSETVDNDSWSDGSDSNASNRSDDSTAKTVIEQQESIVALELHTVCSEKLRVLCDTEQLVPDFITDVQRDGDGGVSEGARQNLLIWLMHFNAFFGLGPDSFALAAAMFDRTLELTIVKPEHVDLLGVACLRIASSLVGPIELQPTPREVCINCEYQFSENDLARMEQILRNKLGLNFRRVVPYDFFDDIRQLTILLGAPAIVSSGEFDQVVSSRLLTSCFYYELMSFRPSTIALAVLMNELDRLAPNFDTSGVVIKLASILAVEENDLQACRKTFLRCTAPGNQR